MTDQEANASSDINALLNKAEISGLYQNAVSSFRAGRYSEAESLARDVIGKSVDHADSYHLLGIIAGQRGQSDSAVSFFNRAIEINPAESSYHLNLAYVLERRKSFSEAFYACKNAVRLNPDLSGAHLLLGNLARNLGYLDQAENSARRALELNPADKNAHGNLLFILAARAQLSPVEMLNEQCKWDQVHGKVGRMRPLPVRETRPLSGRRLRVGYVSSDFRKHPVSFFFEPLLSAHNRADIEVFCYDNLNRQLDDATTERLRGYAEHWRYVNERSDRELAEIINSDRIDILVDLSGYTSGSRLQAFTYRPAPVQATYLGSISATGLEAMDYWITDEVLHPPDTVEKTVEDIYRLPRCSFCYQPQLEAPALSPCPNVDDRVVFGSFSNLSKLTEAVIETWSEILHGLPGSRLLLMDQSLAEPKTRQLLLDRFKRHGNLPERFMFYGGALYGDYMAMYAKVDIVLDTFPRTGGTTTADALWMGVPVVTLAGQRYVERISSSKLTAVGLEDLIACSRKDYMGKALSLAHDPVRRAELRATLRERMLQSPLRDQKGLAQAMETAYRSMWDRYLSGVT